MKFGTRFGSWVGLCSLLSVGVNVACSPSQDPETGDELVTRQDQNGAPYLSTDEILGELQGSLSGVSASDDVEIDHSYDESVVPADAIAEPEDYFEDAEQISLPGPTAVATATPANSIDLRAYSVITNQQNEGSCTAYAVAGAMQVLARASNRRDDMSAQHLWNLQRKTPSIAPSINTAMANYLAPTSVWPNGSFTSPKVSNPNSYGFATITKARSIPQGLNSILTELSAGRPVIAGSTLNDSWRYMNSKGVINPNVGASGNWMHAAHAYVLVGYTNDNRVAGGGYFIVKNSWGTSWGDRGYAYMPYSYCSQQRARGGYCVFYTVDGVDIRGSSNGASGVNNGNNGNGAGASTPIGPFSVRVTYGAQSNGQQSFTLRLEASQASLSQVSHVIYDIHETFGSGAQVRASDSSTSFSTPTYSTYASGWSTNGTTLYLRDGRSIALAGTSIRWR